MRLLQWAAAEENASGELCDETLVFRLGIFYSCLPQALPIKHRTSAPGMPSTCSARQALDCPNSAWWNATSEPEVCTRSVAVGGEARPEAFAACANAANFLSLPVTNIDQICTRQRKRITYSKALTPYPSVRNAVHRVSIADMTQTCRATRWPGRSCSTDRHRQHPTRKSKPRCGKAVP